MNLTHRVLGIPPVKGLKWLAAPLLRRFVLRRLMKALDEDRHDLEAGRYPS
jgi:hypothetical protein